MSTDHFGVDDSLRLTYFIEFVSIELIGDNITESPIRLFWRGVLFNRDVNRGIEHMVYGLRDGHKDITTRHVDSGVRVGFVLFY